MLENFSLTVTKVFSLMSETVSNFYYIVLETFVTFSVVKIEYLMIESLIIL